MDTRLLSCNVDGATLTLHIQPPPPAITKPARTKAGVRALIFVHGFAGTRSENGLFDQLTDDLAAAGFLVISYDARGRGDSTGDYAQTDLATHKSDFLKVVELVEDEFKLTPQQLCAVGFSLGACIVGLAVNSGFTPGAAVYLSPATRPAKSMWPRYDTREIQDCLDRDGYVKKPDNGVSLGRPILESLRMTDLGPNCFDIGIPLLICHGSADTRIPIDHTRECLPVRMGHQTRFKSFAGASHSFRPAQTYWTELSSSMLGWLEESA